MSHRRKAALVVMRVPERQLLAAMRRPERVVNVENFQPARLCAAFARPLGDFVGQVGAAVVADVASDAGAIPPDAASASCSPAGAVGGAAIERCASR
jgi:hypothetical protein